MTYNLTQASEKISKYIHLYKDLLLGKSEKRYSELYKWQNVKVFQDHWDIDAPNISSMLETCFTPSSNLWVGQNYYPVKMLQLFSEMNKEKVRAMFKYLFDEKKDLAERVSNTEKTCDELLEEYVKLKSQKYQVHYIGTRFISLLLFFKYPETYYLYKYSMFSNFCKTFSLPVPKRGADDNLINYFNLCDATRKILLNDKELIQINKSMLNGSCYTDDANHLLTQDFIYVCTSYLTEISPENEREIHVIEDGSSTISEPIIPYYKPEGIHYWLLAPGAGASMWNDFYKQGIAAIGWPKMGNLLSFSSRDRMAEALRKQNPEYSNNHRHTTLALWSFSREMKKGDVIIVKKGTTDYMGYGIITGDYEYNPSEKNYPNQRKVNWIKKGEWPETEGSIVTKTLTDITKYPSYVDRLKKLLGIVVENTGRKSINYWWLNANPKYWKITDFEIGQEQTYTTYNEKGNKRRIYEYFKELRPGDLIIGYESSPTMRAVAILEATNGIHIDEDDGQEKISIVLRQFLTNPASWFELSTIKELEDCDVLNNNQGSLFKLKANEFDIIVKVSSGSEIGPSAQYEIDDALKEVFLGEPELTTILRMLEKKKNILLQGPPGVGKTYLAKRLAYLWMGNKDNEKIEMVQFHQSYSYEDFMQGYRPTEDGNFKLLNGVFYRFCKKAMRNPGEDYFFIIDEINRGNLSKIFGELMMLMESDKRGEGFSIPLIYSPDNISLFYIPQNLYIIGTMNTADRSLAIVDYALRRRFAFIELKPCFTQFFTNNLKEMKVPPVITSRIIDRMTNLNSVISNDRNLGNGFLIGHSYFCHPPADDDFENWYRDVIDYEIAPVLREYWFDDLAKVDDQVQRLY